MGIRKVQMSFTGGELAPAMFGRFDDQKYQQGLAKCRNFITLPQGPATLRPGTAYVNETKYPGKPTRLIPFTFSVDQTMVLEFGEKYIRFHTEGKTLLASNGQPYEVITPYLSEDIFDIHYTQSMDVMTLVHPAYPPQELRRYGVSDWRIKSADFGAPLKPPSAPQVKYEVVAGKDQTITDAEKARYTLKYKVTSVKEILTGVEESAASEAGETKGNLYLNNATCTLTWGSVEGAERYRIYKNYKGLYCFIGETDETSFVDDSYDPDEGITPPIYDDPFLTSKAIREVTVDNGGSGYKAPDGSLKVEEISVAGLGASNTQSNPFSYPSGVTPTVSVFDKRGVGTGAKVVVSETSTSQHRRKRPAAVDHEHYTYYTTITVTKVKVTESGTGYSDPWLRISNIDSSSVSDQNDLGAVKVGSTIELPLNFAPSGAELTVTDSTGWGAELRPVIEGGKIVSVIIRSGGQNYTSPKITVTAPQGSGAVVSASVGKYGDYPGAVCYYEQRRCFAGSPMRPQMVWMSRSGTESDMSYTLPTKDDNRLRFAIAAREASRILHLMPLQQILALTNSTEYRVSSGGSGPMAPDAVRSEVQAQIGASSVQPVIVNSTIVYAAARGGHVREMGYNWQSSAFTTGDLSIRSAHFFDRARVVDMTLSKSPDSIVWCAMSDGSLIGLTYLPEQAIAGWHKHTTIDGAIESVTSVPEGDEDILYMVVRRETKDGGVRFVERMHERYFAKPEDAWHVDCGGEYNGDLTDEISGLTWLEGKMVSIYADGCVLPQQEVKGGKVTLTQPSRHVIVGLPITADLQTLPVAVQLADGSFGMGHMKNVNDVIVRVEKSSGVFVGPDFDSLVEYKQRTFEPYGTPPNPMTKEISIATTAKWSGTGQICIRQKDPLPLTVVSVALDLAK